MRQLPTRVEWQVHRDPGSIRVLMTVGGVTYSLTSGEAFELSNRLVDHAERSERGEP